MIGQTFAIFVDAYRELNSRMLFWVTLALSAVVVGAFALLGADPRGLNIAAFHIDTPDGLVWYNLMFQKIVIGAWLTWLATVLALISTAGIFPDFISGGSVDLYLAKPISRPRLFLTKYFAGLLFVALQVLVVAAGSFLVLGLRAHEWKPRMLLAVPIVVCFFSYLFGICVLLGVKTRSTIAALLLTLLCWGLFAGLDWAEPPLLVMRNVYESQARQEREQAEFSKEDLRRASKEPAAAAMLPVLQQNAETAGRQADSDEHTAKWLRLSHRIVYAVKTVTPKTTDTIDYLSTIVFNKKEETELARQRDREQAMNNADPIGPHAAGMEGARESVRELQARSPWWIIGTSLGFEAVVVGAAMWVFCRRDY